MELSRQEYWSGLPCSSQGIFPTQGSNLGLLNVNMSYLDSERFGADLKQKHITDEEVALTMLLWKREYLVISYFCLCLGMIKK